jgi:hypothetical protein
VGGVAVTGELASAILRMRPAFACLLLMAACSSNGSQDVELASATIGPAGGQIGVDSGPFAGLRLTVPGGSLASDVRVTLVDPASPSYPSGVVPLTYAQNPGPFVRIDPPQIVFATPATLRLPYDTQRTIDFGIGNVQVWQYTTAGGEHVDPGVVDVQLGRVEFAISQLGSFQVVRANMPPIDDYLPAIGTTVPLEDGYSFSYEEVLEPHLPGRIIQRWLIDTGSYWFGHYVERSTVANAMLLSGRVIPSADWQEVWDAPVAFMIPEATGATPPIATTTSIYSPINSLSPTETGTASLLGRFGFEVPLHIGQREFRNVLRIRLLTAWDSPSSGAHTGEQVFWFAPGVGLLQMQVDGVIRIRTDL